MRAAAADFSTRLTGSGSRCRSAPHRRRVNLRYSKNPTPVVATRGSALDHIGFEVRNLEAFCAKLEAAGIKFDMPYTKRPDIGIALAFLTDPWGTYIELTEGLDKF